jgi:hypothetical protein
MRSLAVHRNGYARYVGRHTRRGSARRRASSVRPCYLGRRPRRGFLAPRRRRTAEPLSRLAEWAGGGMMLLAVVSWGVLVALLAA